MARVMSCYPQRFILQLYRHLPVGERFAFIFGLFPLVIAQGAGAATRHAVGTPVFGGMIAASVFGIFLIPLFFIVAERLRGGKVKSAGRSPTSAGAQSRP
jgi:multidrug efflux pump